MKLTAKSLSSFLILVFLGALAGSLGWEVIERILSRMGFSLELGVGPIGLDLSVISLSLKANPGTLLGALSAIVLFRIL